MLPVSGAEQFIASPVSGKRPMISQIGAYSRLVRPAPISESGRNMFHRPAERALSFSFSMVRVPLPLIARGAERVHLALEFDLGRLDVFVHESHHALLQRRRLGGIGKVHGVSPVSVLRSRNGFCNRIPS